MGGGGPSVPANTTQTTTQDPWKQSQPYLLQGLSGVNALFGQPGSTQFNQNALDRITGFSPETQAAMDMTATGAFEGEAAGDQARNASLQAMGIGGTALGQTPSFGALSQNYIDPSTGLASYNLTPQDQAALGVYGDQNAITADLMQSVMDPVQSRINEMAGAAGATGSGMHDYAMAKGLGDAVAPIAFQAQSEALNRGSQMYDTAANRAAGMTSGVLGLADSQYGQSGDILASMIDAQAGIDDATRSNAAGLAQVGVEQEALQDAITNAPYDQLTDYLQRIGYLSGFGGSTSSQVGTQGGGGLGLAQGLGGLLAGASIASAFM